MSNRFVSFFEKAGGWLKKLFTSPTLEQQILTTISYVAPIAETGLSLVAGSAVGAAFTGVTNQIKADLTLAFSVASESTIAAGSAAAAQLKAALTAVQTNFAAILTDADIKNEAKYSDIETAGNLVISELQAAVGALPGATPSAPATT